MLRRRGGAARRAWAASLAGLLCCSALFGCGAGPAPSGVLVTERAARTVLAPRSLVWLSSRQEAGFLPSAVTLGGKTSGRVLLYLEFPELALGAQPLARAYLLLALGASDSAQLGRERVPIELSRAEPARPGMRSWSDQPRAAFPRSSAQLSARGVPLRVDVTEQVRVDLASGKPPRLRLLAEPGEGEGIQIATGASGGVAPRLELYWE